MSTRNTLPWHELVADPVSSTQLSALLSGPPEPRLATPSLRDRLTLLLSWPSTGGLARV